MASLTHLSFNGAVKSVSKSARPATREPLTPRQIEVVRWIAEGRRNAEIGEILNCSTRTVKKHVEHILSGLESRTALGPAHGGMSMARNKYASGSQKLDNPQARRN